MTNKEKYADKIIELAIDEGALALKNGAPARCSKIKCEDSCSGKHNRNSRNNEPCCRCDSKVSENDDTKNKVTSLEIVVRMIDNKPYYEIKYKKVGEYYYHVGYSSFNIDNVLKWRDECFELVDVKATNADRIRNMSDEELAEFIEQISTTSKEIVC